MDQQKEQGSWPPKQTPQGRCTCSCPVHCFSCSSFSWLWIPVACTKWYKFSLWQSWGCWQEWWVTICIVHMVSCLCLCHQSITGCTSFRVGHNYCEDTKCSGWPMKLTPDKFKHITLLLNDDWTLSVRHLATLTNLGMVTVHKALCTIMKLTKCLNTWVPHNLIADQCQWCVDSCRWLLHISAGQRNLLECILMGDESWFLAYDLETKQASAQ